MVLPLMLAVLSVIVPADGQDTPPKTLRFSGYDWEIRDQGTSGPGPNRWSRKNVWVDKSGNLHLKISRNKTAAQDEWYCAELTSTEKFGFGQYTFQTGTRVDRFDRNVVLGLFDYPTSEEGGDGTNEIDIEFARWGNSKYPNGNFTIYPSQGKAQPGNSHTFEYALPPTAPDDTATHRFARSSRQVTLETFAGTSNGKPQRLAQWTFAPQDPRLVPQKPLPIHLNLWPFQGKAPADGKEVEVVIKKFIFMPDIP